MLGEFIYLECRISVKLLSIIPSYLISNNNEYVIYRDTYPGTQKVVLKGGPPQLMKYKSNFSRAGITNSS